MEITLPNSQGNQSFRSVAGKRSSGRAVYLWRSSPGPDEPLTCLRQKFALTTPCSITASSVFSGKVQVHVKILVIGLRLQCPECRQTTWYRLADLDTSLRCERCLQLFDFPAAEPPRDLWAYRVNGPFAIENFAQGAYCVALALNFIDEQLADGTSWIPSVSIKGDGADDLEADFAVFFRPRVFSPIAEPFVIFGESKTFDRFKPKDISRMEQIGKRFPGAVLCFATLNQELTSIEKKAIGRLARKGRRSLRTGQQMNPVLVLTKTELLGQGDPRHVAERLPERFRAVAQNMFFRGDLQEICDFTLQVHLGIESIHEWWKQKAEHKRRKAANCKPGLPSRATRKHHADP